MEGRRSGEVDDQRQSPDELISCFVSQAVAGSVSGTTPQDRQLVMMLPVETFDMEKEAHLDVA